MASVRLRLLGAFLNPTRPARSSLRAAIPTYYHSHHKVTFSTLLDSNSTNHILSQSSCDTRTNMQSLLLTQKRFKKKKGRSSSAQKDDDDDDESSDEEDVAENPLLDDDDAQDGCTKRIVDVHSLRLDSVAKVAFSRTRSKIEEAFYNGEILHNGFRPNKKSDTIRLNDEIILARNSDPEDPTQLLIQKAIVTQIPDKTDQLGHARIHIDLYDERMDYEEFKKLQS